MTHRDNLARTLRQFSEVVTEAGLEPEVSVSTVAVYRDWLDARGTCDQLRRQKLLHLRSYCESRGLECRSWHGESVHEQRFPVTRALHLDGEFSTAYKRFARAVRLGRVDIGAEAVREGEILLYRIAENARETGLPPEFSSQVFEAFFMERKARVGSGNVQGRTLLREVLAVSHPNHTWLRDGVDAHRRTLPQVLAPAYWNSLRVRALECCGSGMVRSDDIKAVDNLLRVTKGERLVSPAVVYSVCGRRASELRRVERAVRKINPNSSLLPALVTACLELKRVHISAAVEKGRAAQQCSALIGTMPKGFRPLCRRGAEPGPYARTGWPIATLTIIRSALKHFERAVPNPTVRDLTAASFAKMAAEMDWTLAATTKLMYVRAMLALCGRAECSADGLLALRTLMSKYRREAKSETRRKERFLSEHDVQQIDLAVRAAELLRIAHERTEFVRALRMRSMLLQAALFAILSIRPFRLSDLRGLVIGESVSRGSDRWRYSFDSMKTEKEMFGVFPDALTPYLDAVICLESGCSGGDEFWIRYAQMTGWPLFSNLNGQPLSQTWFGEACRKAFGSGPHLARTLMADRMAPMGELGHELTMFALGHISPGSAAFYEVRADELRQGAADTLLVQAVTRLGKSLPTDNAMNAAMTDRETQR